MCWWRRNGMDFRRNLKKKTFLFLKRRDKLQNGNVSSDFRTPKYPLIQLEDKNSVVLKKNTAKNQEKNVKIKSQIYLYKVFKFLTMEQK